MEGDDPRLALYGLLCFGRQPQSFAATRSTWIQMTGDYAILGSKILLEVFDDRVVVTSPGTLPNPTSVESALAGGHPRTRNELIANFMMAKGRMEIRGRGLPIVVREMREWNATRPELLNSIDGGFVRLILLR